MAMLKQAFNMISRIHSKAMTIKRPGGPDLYSPCRAMPSNYFRNLQGPTSTIVKGREWVIPSDSLTGTQKQIIGFSAVPSVGGFHLTYNAVATVPIAFDAVHTDVQTALRAVTGLANVTVSGNFTAGFVVTFDGVQTPLLLVAVQEAIPLNVTITVSQDGYVAWTTRIKRGDKLMHPTFGPLAAEEVIEMFDLGGDVMGYRIRTE